VPGYSAHRIIFPAAPWVVEYGAVTGTTAGEFLQIEYTSNLPIDAATLILADGRELELAFDATTLSVLLPFDTADGWAAVRLHTPGQTRTDEQVALLHGIAVPPQQPPAGGPAARRRRPEPEPERTPELRTVQIGSRVLVASATRVRVRRPLGVTALVTVSELRTRSRRRLPPAAVTGMSFTRPRVGVCSGGIVAASSATAVSRRDGPAIEEALLLGELVTGCAFVD
jgi:hypothetical protein